jgi:hypothetical protein
MKVSSGRRAQSRALVVATMSLLLLATACAPPPPPPGVIDLNDAASLRWVKDRPVNARLGAGGVGSGVVFRLENGNLPRGVQLTTDGRLVGIPDLGGLWEAVVSATGTTGSLSRVVGGYVVEKGQIDQGPVLVSNPVRAPFTLVMNDNGIWQFPTYRPGLRYPQAIPLIRFGAAWSTTLDFGTWPEAFGLPSFLSQRSVELRTPPECALTLRDKNRNVIREVVLDSAGNCSFLETFVRFSQTGSTFLVAGANDNGDGTTYRFWLIRSQDGELLRTASSVIRSDGGFPTIVYGADGSLLAVNGATPNTIRVIGSSPLQDKTISFDDGTARVCGLVYTSSAALVGDDVLVSCETPGVSVQVGTADMRSGNVWLSDPIPTTSAVADVVWVAPVALSPAGDQIVIWRGEGNNVFDDPSEPPTVDWSVDELGVLEVGGQDQTIRKIVDRPPGSSVMFLEE